VKGNSKALAGDAEADASFTAPISGFVMRTPPAAVVSFTSDHAPEIAVAFFA